MADHIINKKEAYITYVEKRMTIALKYFVDTDHYIAILYEETALFFRLLK